MNNLQKMIIKNKGATLDKELKPIKATNGYMVSMLGHELKTTVQGLNDALVQRYQALAEELNGYVGMWLDGDTLYLDISQHHTDINQAVTVGKENKQLAIYDIKNGNEIRL